MHRSIDCSTWDDPWFTDLGPKPKLLFLYLITNRRVSQCGAMEITVRQIAFETGLSPAEIPNCIEAMGDRVKWWPGQNLLFVRNFYRHQRANTGDKFDVAARKSIEVLPDFAKEWVWGVYPNLRPNGTAPVVPPHTHHIPTTEPGATHAISVAEAEAEAVDPQTPKGADTHGYRIPDDFAVDDDLQRWAVGKGFIPPEIEHYGEVFMAYWRSESGARARKKDWRQAFQVWLARETPGKWRPAVLALNGMPPEIARLGPQNADRLKWEYEHRPGRSA